MDEWLGNRYMSDNDQREFVARAEARYQRRRRHEDAMIVAAVIAMIVMVILLVACSV